MIIVEWNKETIDAVFQVFAFIFSQSWMTIRIYNNRNFFNPCAEQYVFFFFFSFSFFFFCILVENASQALGDFTSKLNETDKLKEEIQSLQAKLRRNVTVLQQKLQKIKDYASKVWIAVLSSNF